MAPQGSFFLPMVLCGSLWLPMTGRDFSGEPGSLALRKSIKLTLLELPVLALQEELLYGFPVNKKEVLVYKDIFLYI
jgi:hypothetical protein